MKYTEVVRDAFFFNAPYNIRGFLTLQKRWHQAREPEQPQKHILEIIKYCSENLNQFNNHKK